MSALLKRPRIEQAVIADAVAAWRWRKAAASPSARRTASRTARIAAAGADSALRAEPVHDRDSLPRLLPPSPTLRVTTGQPVVSERSATETNAS